MKHVNFKPLRRIKRTGKITVASYMQWHCVKEADVMPFLLHLDKSYEAFSDDEIVYNHAGENLFFFTTNPAEIPVYSGEAMAMLANTTGGGDTVNMLKQVVDRLSKFPREYYVQWHPDSVNANIRGCDCNGTPAFSHYSQKEVARQFNDVTQFEPLTVKTVKFWLGWFLYGLNNVRFSE